jgi:hypothetical protein
VSIKQHQCPLSRLELGGKLSEMPEKPKGTYKSKAILLLSQHILLHWDGKQKHFAEAIGVDERYMSRWMRGRSRPQLGAAVKIELLTEQTGEPVVRCRNWFEAS